LDIYYLGFENERAVYAVAAGAERRQSIGARFFGARNGWDWDWEAVGQFGRFAQQDIAAWGVATNTGYTFDVAAYRARVGIKTDVASGSRNPTGSTLGTFNALFPKLPYFNSAGRCGAVASDGGRTKRKLRLRLGRIQVLIESSVTSKVLENAFGGQCARSMIRRKATIPALGAYLRLVLPASSCARVLLVWRSR